MKNVTSWVLRAALGFLSLSACSEPPEIGVLVFEDGPRARRDEPTKAEDPPEKEARVTMMAVGHPRGFGLGSAEELETYDLPDGLRLRDASLIGGAPGEVRGSFVATDSEGEAGLLFRLAAGELAEIGAWDGALGVVAFPTFDLLFQRRDGDRWIVARHDGAPVPSVGFPLPTSLVRVSDSPDGACAIEAVVLYEGRPRWATAPLSDSGVGPCSMQDFEGPGASELSRSFRVAPGSTENLPGGAEGDLAVDVRGGVVALSRASAGTLSPWTSTLYGAETVEGVVTFVRESDVIVAVTQTGPDGLLLLQVSRGGLELEDGVFLPLEPIGRGSIFSRSMGRSGDALFVATRRGAFTLSLGDNLPGDLASIGYEGARAPIVVLP